MVFTLRAALLGAVLGGVGCAAFEGPAGPDGAPGAVGPQGQEGPPGDDGADGDAGILYSDWFEPPTWTAVEEFGTTVLTHDEAVPEIDADIVDRGLVLVYGRLGGYADSFWDPDAVAPLPITVTYWTGDIRYEDHWHYRVAVGNLQLRMTNNENLYSALAGGYEFRYVIIPGGTALADSVAAGLPQLPYHEAMDVLGIPEDLLH